MNSSRERRGRSHRTERPPSSELPRVECDECSERGPPPTFCSPDPPSPPSRRGVGADRVSMKREILINANPRETRVAILEDDQLVELLVDRPEARRMVGDIYLGRVEAVLPGIQAAFVDIGTEKSAFLHASDLVYPDADGERDDEDEDDDAEDGARDDKEEAREGRGRRSKAPPIQDL